MHKYSERESPSPTPEGYLLPEDAHLALLQTRDQLRLLALLADPRGRGEPDLTLRPAALAECFRRLAGDLDAVAGATVWPAATIAK